MKKIEIISATPELLKSPFSGSIMKRAVEKKIVEINFHDLKNYSSSKKKQIDDYQFGGGSGMVLMIEPIFNCINFLKKQKCDSYFIPNPTDPAFETLNNFNNNNCSTDVFYAISHGVHRGVLKEGKSDEKIISSIEYSCGK